ncbi:hypothetical protein [Nocardia terpenica]|uniref:Uncharacterized protein n=1 Tax=Nocardia terpenica TaxID=455432 RepID=A0A291RHC0_9NOCA|nr:hypothetical protein [Nocardia terpenica]ATL66698.1 hypothetical protein CRH09_11235 [Nocardia terpenica]
MTAVGNECIVGIDIYVAFTGSKGNRLRTQYRGRGGAILTCALAGAASLVGPGWVTPAAAKPDTVVMTCEETGKVTWLSDGLGNEPGEVQWTNTKEYTNCKDPNGGTLTIPTPVSSVSAGTETASCDGTVTEHSGTGIMTWSDKSTSTIATDVKSETKSKGNGKGDFPITITSGTGKDLGYSAEDVDTLKVDGTCPGLKSATTTGTLTISK